ncbi:hypothetical protein Tsubulata_042143 [Turnera subulata]|uniref:Uncharacterized protein n=1 Tax=Turnera subulata TaxID=218843 RepID=A0A9Q0J8B6_9ROSI|nr:hypothetical protein Tsubulata_042143 [Turnera subulata]
MFLHQLQPEFQKLMYREFFYLQLKKQSRKVMMMKKTDQILEPVQSPVHGLSYLVLHVFWPTPRIYIGSAMHVFSKVAVDVELRSFILVVVKLMMKMFKALRKIRKGRENRFLHSLDNDTVIGSKNKIKAVRPSPLKNQKLTQSRHSQCKVITNHASDESSVNTRKAKTRADKGTKMPVPAFSSHKR